MSASLASGPPPSALGDSAAPNAIAELAPLVSYLAVIVWLLHRTWPLRGDIANRSALLFCGLGLFALGLTWTNMFRFMSQSARDHAAAYTSDRPWTAAEWLRDISLFKQAWERVCSTTARWWWSSQICLVTAAVWTPILYAEARHQARLGPPSLLQAEMRIKPRSLMLVGQLVAISFASAQSFAAILLGAVCYPPRRRCRAPASLVGAALGGIALTAITPSTVGTSRFLPVLLALHAFLFWPLLSPSPESRGLLDLSTLYFLSAFASGALGVMHSRAAMQSVRQDPRALLAVAFRSDPAQASVSWDVACVTGILIVWLATETLRMPTMRGDVRAWGVLGVAIAVTPVLGIACTAPAYLALVELERLEESPDETSVASWRGGAQTVNARR